MKLTGIEEVTERMVNEADFSETHAQYRAARTPWRPFWYGFTQFTSIIVALMAVALVAYVLTEGFNADYNRQKAITDAAIRRNVNK